MSLQYQEDLIDLGQHGFLVLTTEGLHPYPPLPAHRFGYAYWYDNTDTQHDRFALCMRHVPRDTLLQLLAEKSAQYVNAPPSVRGRVEWTYSQACDDYFEAPSRAKFFGEGLVLLIFAGALKPHLLRVIDVARGVVVAEETTDSLSQRLGIDQTLSNTVGLSHTVLLAAGSRHADMYISLQRQMLVLAGDRFERAKLPIGRDGADTQFSSRFLFLKDRESAEFRSIVLDQSHEVRVFKTRYGRKGYAGLSGAQGADRCAVAHESGTVEIIDGEGNTIAAIRPFPQISRSQIGVSISHSGRYLRASFYEEGGTRVVDIDNGMIAAVDVPWWNNSYDRLPPFSPEIHFRPATIVSDKGVLSISSRARSLVSFADIDWQTAIRPGGQGSGSAKRSLQPAFKRHLDAWRKPALALRPAKLRKSGKTRLYGLPNLPAGMEWPNHDGHPMLLLCQIDLAVVSDFPGLQQLPQEGLLWFFIAVDAEGEYLEEDFNPVATRVVWSPRFSDDAKSHEDNIPCRKAQPMRLVRDEAEFPQIDAAIVKAQLFSDGDLEEYRVFLDASVPEGPQSGHRLGGYPTLLQNNDLEAQAERASTGEYPEEGQQGWLTSARWRLLLQLDSDDEFMWGTDSGMLYFFIHEDDLAQHNFTRVKAFCEGS